MAPSTAYLDIKASNTWAASTA